MSSDEPHIENIEKIGYQLFIAIQKSKKFSKQLIKLYPANQQALRLYGSFLLEVYNNTVKGNDLVSRAEHQKQQAESKNASIGDKFNYFDESNGIIIISASPDDVGTITSINNHACSILAMPIRYIIGQNIANFIPPPITPMNHNVNLLSYIKNTNTCDVIAPFSLMMVDSFGFMIEIYFKAKLVALDTYPFFLTAIKKNLQPRELILYDSESVIILNTRGFAQIVGFSDGVTQLAKMDGNRVLNEFSNLRKKHADLVVFEYLIPGTVNKVYMKFVDYTFKSTTFKLLYATNDEDEKKS